MQAYKQMHTVGYVGLARAHKVLHHKQPLLVPLMDNLTAQDERATGFGLTGTFGSMCAPRSTTAGQTSKTCATGLPARQPREAAYRWGSCDSTTSCSG